MAIEQLMQAVLTASPEKRKALESVLNGETEATKKNEKPETRLVTISGAARLLSVGRGTIYALIEQGRLDTVDLSGSRRITMRSLNAYLDGKRPANEKTAAKIEENKAKYAAAKNRKAMSA